MSQDDCLFCRIIEGSMDADVVHEDEDVLAFRDINPQAPTHILVIPRKHIASVNELEDDDATLVGKLYLAARDLAREEGIAENGYRLVMNTREGAGQSVFHIHLHLLGGRSFRWPPG
ncbi:MAG: histidine triad nucleotide-binding protein [Longimicrobiales bacterium]|nr:histidine triad nucleotide-binding protein [Longimicrobiales bacterium]